MRLHHILELTKANLIYANPQMIEKKRNKEAKTGQRSKVAPHMTVLLQSGFLLLVFLLIYGFMFSAIDFSQYPGMFTTLTLLFIVMALLQGFYVVYNLFYESKDLIHYLPLPFKGSEVFLAKLTVLALMMLPYLIPILGLFIMLGQDAGHPFLLSLIASVPLFILLTVVVFFFSVVLVHLITKLAVFRKNKQLVTTVLYSASSFGMIAVIFYLSSMDPSSVEVGQVAPDTTVIPFIHFFYALLLDPSDLTAWLGLGLWIALLAALMLIVFKWVVPGFYREEEIVSVKSSKQSSTSQTSTHHLQHLEKTTGKKKTAASHQHPVSVNRTLWKYNLGLIQDGTLIMQHISSSILFPIFLLGPMVLNGLYLGELSLNYWALFFFGGFVYAFLTLNAISIVGVIISLDRENFQYMKSLPFSMKNYLKQKFLFAFVIELSLPLVLGLLLIFIAKVPLLLGFLFLSGMVIGIFTLCQYYFARDYRLLDFEWQNLTELFNRGGGNFAQFISIFGSFFIGFIVILFLGLLFTTLSSIGQLLLSLLIVLIPFIASCLLTIRYQKRFWSQFND